MNIYLPQELVETLESSFKRYEGQQGGFTSTKRRNFRDDTYFICLHILLKIAQGKDSRGEENLSFRQSANISSLGMKYYVNKYNLVLDFLQDEYIIKAMGKYSTGEWGKKSYAIPYGFSNTFESSALVKTELKNPYLLSKIMEPIKPINGVAYLEEYRTDVLNRIILNYEQAESFLVQRYKSHCCNLIDFYRQYAPIYRLKINRFYYKVEEAGRFHHSLTGLNNELRQFLRIEKEPDTDWVEVDISACSSFLLSTYLISKGKPSKDLLTFDRLTKAGDFYTELLEYYFRWSEREEGGADEELEYYRGHKKRIKDAVLKFYNRGAKGNRNKSSKDYLLYMALRAYFPSVFKSVEMLNKDARGEDNNSVVYKTITSMESSVMVDYLIPELLDKKHIAITRHDGVLCLRKDAEQIKAIIEEGFRVKLGQVPHVRIKALPDIAK